MAVSTVYGLPFDHVTDYLRALAVLCFGALAVQSWRSYVRLRRGHSDR